MAIYQWSRPSWNSRKLSAKCVMNSKPSNRTLINFSSSSTASLWHVCCLLNKVDFQQELRHDFGSGKSVIKRLARPSDIRCGSSTGTNIWFLSKLCNSKYSNFQKNKIKISIFKSIFKWNSKIHPITLINEVLIIEIQDWYVGSETP